MKTKLAFILAAGILGIGTEEEPGWLAEALASTDVDVDAAIAAYQSEDYAGAIARLDAAVARRGERSELYYDRGLALLGQGDVDNARAAFQHGTESRELQVRASSHYELGNLAMQGEDFEGAIAAYIACLTAQPTHQNAKWNLELALQLKEEQEKQEQEEQDQEQDQDQEGDQDQEQDQDQEGEQGEEGEQQEQDEQEQEQEGEQEQDQDQQGEQEQEGEQEQQEQEQGEQEQQQQPEQQPGEEEQQAQPQPIEAGELDSALDELDRQDAFMFGRPRGQGRKVEKDW